MLWNFVEKTKNICQSSKLAQDTFGERWRNVLRMFEYIDPRGYLNIGEFSKVNVFSIVLNIGSLSKLRKADVLSVLNVLGATIFRRHCHEKAAEYQSYHLFWPKCWFWNFFGLVLDFCCCWNGGFGFILLKWWFWKREQEFNRNSVSPPDSVECEKQNLFARFHFSNIINSQWNCRFYVFTKLEKTFRLACSNGCLLCLQCLGDSIQVELKSRMLVVRPKSFQFLLYSFLLSEHCYPGKWQDETTFTWENFVTGSSSENTRATKTFGSGSLRTTSRTRSTWRTSSSSSTGSSSWRRGSGWKTSGSWSETTSKVGASGKTVSIKPPKWLLWMSKAIFGRYDVLALLPLDLLYLKFGRECTLLRWMSELMVDSTEKHFLLGCRVSPIDGGLYLNSSGCPVSPSSETSWSFSADLVRIRSLLRWL